MAAEVKPDIDGADDTRGLLTLALLTLIVGAGAGLIGAAFRLALEHGDHLRTALIVWAHGRQFTGFLLVTTTSAAAVAIAAWLVCRFSPVASGSGVPHVEAVLRGELPHAPFGLVPIKFVGGLLAIGSGLALGREGPSIQMGASIGHLDGTGIPARRSGLPGTARRRRGRRPGHGLQRTDRRRDICAGGTGAAV